MQPLFHQAREVLAEDDGREIGPVVLAEVQVIGLWPRMNVHNLARNAHQAADVPTGVAVADLTSILQGPYAKADKKRPTLDLAVPSGHGPAAAAYEQGSGIPIPEELLAHIHAPLVDKGQGPSVSVPRLFLADLDPDPAAEQDLFLEVPCLLIKGLSEFGRVHTYVTNTFAPIDLDRVAIDHPLYRPRFLPGSTRACKEPLPDLPGGRLQHYAAHDSQDHSNDHPGQETIASTSLLFHASASYPVSN